MRRLFVLAALFFALPSHAVTIDWVTVGDPGNACEVQPGDYPPPGGCFGSVDYVYRISKYEVTNAQYAEFLNAVAATDPNFLYSGGMVWALGGIIRSGSAGSYTYSTIAGRENMPVNCIGFFDSIRFANWLHNGQPSGVQDATTTEDGAYTFEMFNGSLRARPRNAGATIFLPSEDEWYKAAYYDAVSASYFDYPAGSDAEITCALPGATPNTANCWRVVDEFSDVGSYTGSSSPYGTFDQGGNIWEWTEAKFGSTDRIVRGGSFGNRPSYLAASNREYMSPTWGSEYTGFRVAMIPECDDWLDNDSDGFTDYPEDPGCADADDVSERSPDLICDDGVDNDSDGRIDFDPVTHADPGDQFMTPSGSGDPGCINPSYFTENPHCQDGIDNDGDGQMDYDAGLSTNGSADPAGPDPYCVGKPWVIVEGLPCGLGVELALLLPPLVWLSRRRRRSRD